jgi:hypothetical protein
MLAIRIINHNHAAIKTASSSDRIARLGELSIGIARQSPSTGAQGRKE